MKSIGASSRSPSPMTIVPRIGSVSIALPHRLDRDLVGVATLALPHRARGRDRRLLHHPQELARQMLLDRHAETSRRASASGCATRAVDRASRSRQSDIQSAGRGSRNATRLSARVNVGGRFSKKAVIASLQILAGDERGVPGGDVGEPVLDALVRAVLEHALGAGDRERRVGGDAAASARAAASADAWSGWTWFTKPDARGRARRRSRRR